MNPLLLSKPEISIRETQPSDFYELHTIRMAVKENVLSNPALITESDYTEYITVRGKGWLAEVDNTAAGFAIVDCVDHNIWALFVKPGFDQIGVGRKLHDTMLEWYFSNYDEELWLGTAPDTRAESFYRAAGWKENGMHKGREIKFTMSSEDWNNRQK